MSIDVRPQPISAPYPFVGTIDGVGSDELRIRHRGDGAVVTVRVSESTMMHRRGSLVSVEDWQKGDPVLASCGRQPDAGRAAAHRRRDLVAPAVNVTVWSAGGCSGRLGGRSGRSYDGSLRSACPARRRPGPAPYRRCRRRRPAGDDDAQRYPPVTFPVAPGGRRSASRWQTKCQTAAAPRSRPRLIGSAASRRLMALPVHSIASLASSRSGKRRRSVENMTSLSSTASAWPMQ